jgi:hypothetical protein
MIQQFAAGAPYKGRAWLAIVRSIVGRVIYAAHALRLH